MIGKNLEEFGVVISIEKRVGHARVCPTVRGATFSPRTWDQGSLCPGFGPKKKDGEIGRNGCVNFQLRKFTVFRNNFSKWHY